MALGSLLLFILPTLGFTWPIIKGGTHEIRILPSDFHEVTANIMISEDIDITYLKIQLNTGSNDLWVTSAFCDFAKTWCNQKGHFNYLESHSYKDAHREFTTTIKDTVLTGFVGTDTVSLESRDGVLVNDMEFGQAVGSNADLDWGAFDGVVGLGPLRKSSVGVTFLQRLLQQGLDDAVFSFDFWSSPENPVLRIGSLKHDLYTGDMFWNKITSDQKWEVASNGVSAGEASLCGKGCQIQFNSGIELIVGPKQQVDKFNKIIGASELPGTTLTSVDCSKISSLPSLTLHLGDATVSISPEQYVERHKIATFELCYTQITAYETAQDGAENLWIMGAAAHKGLFVAYDFGRSLVGVAQSSKREIVERLGQ